MRRGAILAVVVLSVTACGHAPDTAAPETTSVTARATTTTAPAPPHYSIVGQVTRDDGKPVYYVLVDPVNVGDDGFQRDVKRVLEALSTKTGGPDFSANVFDDRTLAADEYAHRTDPSAARDRRAQHLVATYAGRLTANLYPYELDWYPAALSTTARVGRHIGAEQWEPDGP
jgi:hypothetical protein